VDNKVICHRAGVSGLTRIFVGKVGLAQNDSVTAYPFAISCAILVMLFSTLFSPIVLR
jgi:hypothetical protein